MKGHGLLKFPFETPAATSFQGSLIFPPPGARGEDERRGGKMRDPGNEVALAVFRYLGRVVQSPVKLTQG